MGTGLGLDVYEIMKFEMENFHQFKISIQEKKIQQLFKTIVSSLIKK